jgi:NAD(P)-dependent dehydrogenase (short-subunit alcohol dehydrogenase family)
MSFEGKVAVITGAGSGIGRAIARKFAALGAKVIVAEIDEGRGAETAGLIRSDGGDAMAVVTDVSRSDSVATLFAGLDAQGLVPEILVNNAGNASPAVPIHEVTDEAWNAKIGVHLNGTFHCTREALRRMLPRKRGVIINMGSLAGTLGLPGASAYTAAKGAIIALTKGVAREVAEAGIRINCIAPGWVETPILNNLSDEVRANILQRIPMGRLGTPEDIAHVAAFLASDESGYFTGQTISPNGGSSM